MKTRFLLSFLFLSYLTFLPAQVTVTKVYNFNNWINWGSVASYGLTALRPNGFFVNSSGSYTTGRLSKQVGFSGLTGDSCMVYSIANVYTPTYLTWHVAASVSVSNAATPADEKTAFADFKIPYGASYTVSFKAKSTAIPTAFSYGFVESAKSGYDVRVADNWTLLKNISTQALTSAWQDYSYSGTNLTMKTDVTPNLPVDLQNFTFQLSLQNKNVYIDDLTFSYTMYVPDAPVINTLTPGDGSLTVNFTAGSPKGSPISNYKYSTDGGATFIDCSPAQITSPITIAGLTNGTAYNVQIKAVNAVGDGIATASTSGTPSGTTGVNSTTSNKLSYSLTDGILKIRNTIKGTNYSIQNISGQTVYSGMIENEELNVKLNQKGIYLVSVEGKTCKVIY